MLDAKEFDPDQKDLEANQSGKMLDAKEFDPDQKDPEDKFKETLRLNFDGNPLNSPKPMQQFLTMLSKEKDTYDGSAALKAFACELCKKEISRTLENLYDYLFSTERNPPTLDQCNPNGEAASPRLGCTLKVKVYMGDGWKVNFKYLGLFTRPDLYVKVAVVSGDEPMMRTTTKRNNWKPTWGEEFSFKLVDPETASLSIKVCDHNFVTRAAGQITLPVALLSPGIRSVPLLFKDGRKCSATRLLMRFEFV